jgi:hypothetical protein
MCWEHLDSIPSNIEQGHIRIYIPGRETLFKVENKLIRN